MVPVHAADPVAVRRHARSTISEQATGVTEGKPETQSGISDAALDQRAEGRRAAVGDGALEHVGAQRVDDDQAELSGRVHRVGAVTAARTGRSPEHAQPLVLALGAAVAGGREPQQREERDQAEGLNEDREGGDDEGPDGDDQADRRGAPSPAPGLPRQPR